MFVWKENRYGRRIAEACTHGLDSLREEFRELLPESSAASRSWPLLWEFK